jgi:single-strand DNA-binding protein
MDMSSTVFEGNVTKDLELATAGSGKCYLRFSLANTYRAEGRDDHTTYIDCVAFGQLAENIAASAGKGVRLSVEGRLNQSNWTTQDGQKRSKLELIVDSAAVSLRWVTVGTIVKNVKAGDSQPEPDESLSEPADDTESVDVGY